MARSILILTEPGDLHAYAVAEGLRRKGAEVVLWHTSDFPTRCDESVLFEESRREVRILGQGIDLTLSSSNGFDVVWRRRPSYVLEAEALHPADRKFADYECNFFRRALFDLLSSASWWVNSPAAALRADSKPLQLATALKVGLKVPDTLYGNDPLQIREFIQHHSGTVVYKPFRGQTWVKGDVSWAPYTALLTEETLVSDELLRLVPGIYQALVPKAYELRVTFIGSRSFSAQILSQDTEKGRLDWRQAYDELAFRAVDLPEDVHSRCVSMMAELGIVFGCFDFIVTPTGDYVFLEVNEMGQFLFVESHTGQPLLDAFCEFLLQGRTDFAWEDSPNVLHYEEVVRSVQLVARDEAGSHVQPPDGRISETEVQGR